jgi:hypothetical protein
MSHAQTAAGIAANCCYRESATTFCRDFDAFTGLLTAAPVALSCANENGVKAAGWMLQQRFDILRPCFRPFQHPSAPFVGARPSRKLGPEEKSHIFLSSAVVADRNVA